MTYGSMMINLTSSASSIVVWSVGPRSSGQMHLNGTGFANFNWTAPVSGYYLLSFQTLKSSTWLYGSDLLLSAMFGSGTWTSVRFLAFSHRLISFSAFYLYACPPGEWNIAPHWDIR